MALTFGLPRQPYLEFYLDNDWRNLANHIRQTTDIKIERSRKNEQAKPTPSELSFVLDDGPEFGNGDYSPRNPFGQWFPNFTRNIPVRYGLEILEDDFSRTVASGWGTTSQGAVWTATGISTHATSVGSGQGIHSVTSTSAYALTYLDEIECRNPDVSVSYTIDNIALLTGGALEPANLVLRGQDNDTYYMLRVSISATEVVTVAIHKFVDSVETILQPANTISTLYSGQQWSVRFQMDGRTLRGKTWPTASGEPLNWDIQHVLQDTQTPFGAGYIGLRSGVAASNSNAKPILFEYTNFKFRHPRFAGETTEVVPKMDLSENIRVTEIECGTIFRRMQQRKSPAKSTLRRYVENNVSGLIGYWPCEDERFTSEIASGIPEGPPMQVAGGITDVLAGTMSATGGITTEFAVDDSIACSAPLPHNNLSTWVVYLTDYPDNARFDIRFLRRLPSSGNTSPAIPLWSLEFFNRGSANRWIITNEGSPEGALALQVYDRSGNIYTSPGGTLPSVFDRTLLWYWQIAQNVTDIDWSLSYVDVADGTFTNYTSGTILNQTIGRAISLASISGLQGQDWSPKDMVVGHIMIGRTQVASSNFFDPVVAYFGESAAARLYRLATEYDLPVIAQVHPDDVTALMGPQLTDTLLDILIECGNTDMGLFGDARSSNALSYLCLEKIYGQTPLVTLDHDSEHLAEPFEPTDDDANTVNDVTAKARRGSSFRLEQTEGPLNVNDPGTVEGAVGRYDDNVEVNPGPGNQLRDAAAWTLHLGTTDEARFPEINVTLHDNVMLDDPNLVLSILDVDFGDVLTVANLESWFIYEDIDQLVLGYTEILTDAYQHTIQYNTAPFSPYHVGRLGEIRLDSSDSSLSNAIDDNDTVFDVTTPDVLTRWVTEADQINTAWISAASGTTTTATFVSAAPNAAEINIGDNLQLYTSVGVLKEATVFTVTNVTGIGTASVVVTFSPAAAVAVSTGNKVRTYFADNFPFDIMVGGERMTVTDINLTSDPQQFVVTRGINGVTKAHSAGAKVQLAEPYYLAK